MTTVEIPSKENDDHPIQFCINTILKEAKDEDRLVRQTLYTMLSAYTNNPINLAINSPSGEGKSYVLHKVGELFPPEDVTFVAGMTDKALFHRPGKLVIKNEVGEYESIEDKISKIDSEICDKESEVANSKDSNLKEARQNQIKELQRQKNDLRKDARKLIDLSHKIIIFQDTPNLGLLIALMPLLSHDKYQVEYEFVDTYNGIKTKTNVLRGWPAVIFSQAIDYSQYKRYPEIQRRFIITNPKMSAGKYSDAVKLTGDKFGLPDFAYQEEIVSDAEKEKARDIINEIKQKISLLCDRVEPGKNNVIIPFHEAITAMLPAEKAADMTTAKRLFSLMCLSALINVDMRPRYILRKEGDPILHTIPFVTFEDLYESVSFMEYSAVDGVRQYIMEWYIGVFLVAYDAKKQPDSKERKGEIVSEKRIGLTSEQLADATFQILNKKLSTKQILENYVDPLVNQGYIDNADSDLDRRSKIFYPVLTSKIRKLFDSDQSNNLLQSNHILITNPILYPDKQYIISKIRHVLKYSSEKACNIVEKIVGHENKEISIEEIVDTYYNNAENYFQVPSVSDQKEVVSDEFLQNGEITSELQIKARHDTGYIHSSPETCEKLFDDSKSNNFLFPCYYCDYQIDVQGDYEGHVVMKHKGKLAYPGKAYLERLGIEPKGKSWEMYGP
jgi:hypothetical protein